MPATKFHRKYKATPEDHARAVKALSNNDLNAVIANLKHNHHPWAKARRWAAIDEAEQRRLLK